MSKDFLIIAFLSASITAGITTLGQIIVTLINRKYEDKKHKREIVMRSAMEATKLNYEKAELLGKGNKPALIYPLEIHAIKMQKLSELVESDNIAPDQIRKVMNDILLAADTAESATVDYYTKKKVL